MEGGERRNGQAMLTNEPMNERSTAESGATLLYAIRMHYSTHG